MEDFAPYELPDRYARFNRQELYAHTATDHRTDFERGERQINRERESYAQFINNERYA